MCFNEIYKPKTGKKNSTNHCNELYYNKTLLFSQHEEEERIKKQQEEEKRLKEEQQRQAELAKMRELEEQKRQDDERKRIEEERRRLEEEARLQVCVYHIKPFFFTACLHNNFLQMI